MERKYTFPPSNILDLKIESSMTIETKFNIGDKVYVLFDNFIRVAFILEVLVYKEKDRCHIQYRVRVKDKEQYIYDENKIHETKEDLFKYLSMYVS